MKNSQYPTIHAEIANLQLQIKLCNFPGKIQREFVAAAQLDSFKASNGRFMQPMSADEQQMLAFRSEHQQAQAQRAGAEREITGIEQDIEHLNSLLNADDQAAQTQKEIKALAALTNAARGAVDSAQSTHAEIESLVAAEMQALDQTKAEAAAAVLAQVKAGKSGKLPPVSRERLDALTLAQEAASAELITAQESLAECAANLADAHQSHAQALAGATERTLHLISRDYAKALRNHKAATYACGMDFDEPDVGMLVRQLENAAAELEAEEE